MSPSSGSDGKSSPRKLSPFVFWAQSERGLSFRVSLQEVSEPSVQTSKETLTFSASGIGANKGRNEYYFRFDFFRNVNPDSISVITKGPEVEILLEKEEPEWWPRLMQETTKPAWLKLDFDKLQTDDDDDEEENTFSGWPGNKDQSFSSLAYRGKKSSRKSVEDFRKIYLFLYNLSQFVGFLYILIVLSIQYAKEGPAFMEKSYAAIKSAVCFCHLLQLLEFIHPLLGYTSGSPHLPFLQVFGRFVMIFGMINTEPRIQSKPAVFYLLYTYALIEIIRYPYYMLRVYKVNISFITWLRYTIWIPLYPFGFLCEGIIILRNIPYFEETSKFSLFLPNPLNFSFYFPTLMRLYLLFGLFPLMYFMMNHMYRQRAKILDRYRDHYLKFN